MPALRNAVLGCSSHTFISRTSSRAWARDGITMFRRSGKLCFRITVVRALPWGDARAPVTLFHRRFTLVQTRSTAPSPYISHPNRCRSAPFESIPELELPSYPYESDRSWRSVWAAALTTPTWLVDRKAISTFCVTTMSFRTFTRTKIKKVTSATKMESNVSF